MKSILKLLMKLVGVAAGAFVLTFTIYIFNLDMKALAMLEPFIKKLQDKAERDQHL